MEMYKTMMGNPEMYEMLINMINGEISKMKHDMRKNEINELKRASFKKFCDASNLAFKEKFLETPQCKIRFYYDRPTDYSSPVPVTMFLKGLEGPAEEEVA